MVSVILSSLSLPTTKIWKRSFILRSHASRISGELGEVDLLFVITIITRLLWPRANGATTSLTIRKARDQWAGPPMRLILLIAHMVLRIELAWASPRLNSMLTLDSDITRATRRLCSLKRVDKHNFTYGNLYKNIFERYEQLLPTRLYASQNTRKGSEGERWYRLCGKVPESVAHIVFGCGALAQMKNLSRHNSFLKVLFYEMLHDLGLIDEIRPGTRRPSQGLHTSRMTYKLIGTCHFLRIMKTWDATKLTPESSTSRPSGSPLSKWAVRGSTTERRRAKRRLQRAPHPYVGN